MENRSKGNVSLDDQIVLNYLAILNHLSTELKLKLIAKLSENMAVEVKTIPEKKVPSWKSLYGVWSDMEENVAEEIRAARLPEREVLNFDQ